MPYYLPNFNLKATITTTDKDSSVVTSFDSICALQYGGKKQVGGGNPGTSLTKLTPIMYGLFPKGTPFRGADEGSGYPGDTVELPLGSGRLYHANWIDDVSKGYATEYRCAVLVQVDGFEIGP